jgi:hypothetical protein
MRFALFFVCIMLSCPAVARTPCEHENPEVTRAIAGLTAGKTPEEMAHLFDVLTAFPRIAACHLVNELHPVVSHTIMPTEAVRFRSVLHVIWSIRALRYIAACQDFRAATKERFRNRSNDTIVNTRTEFLARDGIDEVPFFSVWMSRDIIFVAAADVQTAVIAKWRVWLGNDPDFRLGQCEEFERWYF